MSSDAFSYVDGPRTLTFTDVLSDAAQLRASVPEGGSTALRGPSGLDLVTAVIGLDGHAGRVTLVPQGMEVAKTQPFDTTPVGPTEWIIYTSGSTGAPRPISHTLESLSKGVRSNDSARVWGLVYDPARLAGLAVLLQALATGSTVVDARAGTISERVSAMRDAGVTALSATPTLWRQFLQSGRTAGWNLEQVTLGGETSDQRILDALALAFPAAHVTHVFAATETGVAFAVGDGREGFPARYLEDAPRGVELEIRDGVLWVGNAASGAAGEDGFASTGDAVEIRDDRVVFAGRVSGMVNVGGTKVFPEQVERVLREHPDVADVLVTARTNALSGQILVAAIEAVGGSDNGRLPTELRKWTAQRLPRPMVPAQFTVVDELPRSQTGKVVRP
jgi:acyl-coenzyme A synthetase/AMP-(fatty) acid ligase